MYDILFLIGIICAVLAGIFLILAIISFIVSRNRGDKRDVSGDHADSVRQRRMITVSRMGDQGVTRSKLATPAERPSAAPAARPASSPAAAAPVAQEAVPKQSSKKISPDFIIEKSIMFVSTDEIM